MVRSKSDSERLFTYSNSLTHEYKVFNMSTQTVWTKTKYDLVKLDNFYNL